VRVGLGLLNVDPEPEIRLDAGTPPFTPQLSAGGSIRMIRVSLLGTPTASRFSTIVLYSARLASIERAAMP
jgi:hypothetical protein